MKIQSVMVLFSRKNLFYSDYKWTVYAQTDPHVSGKPDDTTFNKEEGNEVVYLINKLMLLWDYRFPSTGNKIEKLIHDNLPQELSKQQEVQAWLRSMLKF